MMVTEIAALLGVATQEETAQAIGVPADEIMPAALERPTLVLDFRDADEPSRWARYAKPPIPELRKPLRLDGVTGLRIEEE